MKLETTRFGEIDVKDEEVIEFVQGLYGFKSEKEFVLLADDDTPFFWLQSVNNAELAFVVTEPWHFYQEYEFELDDEVKEELKLEDKEDVLVVNIIVVPEEPEEMTMNLKAPIVVNKREKIAKQIILEDEDYPVKYKIFENQGNISA